MPDGSSFNEIFGRYLREHGAAIVERIVEGTYREVPGYRGVPPDELHEATRRTLEFLATATIEGAMPTEDDWGLLDTETVRRRVRQGVRAKDWLEHGRVFREVVFDAAEECARERGVSDAEATAAMLAIDEAGYSGSRFATAEFDTAADELLQEDAAQRKEFVTSLLRGALTPAAMRSGAAAIGLDPGAVYRAVRIRPLDGPDPDEILRAILRSEPTVAPHGVWTALDDDVCGITHGQPPGELREAAAGIGPAVPLEAVSTSFAVATTAVETAERFSLRGAHSIEDLGALPIVAAGGTSADALVERFVAAVERSGTGGAALIETVAAYLEHGLQPGPTARALHLHPNSLRKRLRRYEELVRADLSSMDDLAAIWCAFRRREMHA